MKTLLMLPVHERSWALRLVYSTLILSAVAGFVTGCGYQQQFRQRNAEAQWEYFGDRGAVEHGE